MRRKAGSKKGSVFVNTTYRSGSTVLRLFPGNTGKKYKRKFEHAQFVLDETIKHDTEPYVPYRKGTLANSVNLTPSGNGVIEWSGDPAQFLYRGKLMVYEKTGSTWAPKDEEKIVAKPEKALQYDQTAHPLAGALWYDRAYKDHHKEWVKAAKKAFKEG